MTLFTFTQDLFLPVPRETVFPFFSAAENLEAITPPLLRFHILSATPIQMRAGTLIEYQLRVRGIPIRWQSAITAWDPPHHFRDEQRRGPYRVWIHDHTFESRDGGTLCHDTVRYAVWGGRFIERLFVRRDLERIFDYRKAALTRIFAGSGPEKRGP
jgi:ligand-binding SRPBCC domain-containing protein